RAGVPASAAGRVPLTTVMDANTSWVSDETYRVLAYRFRIRTASPGAAELVRRALGACTDPATGSDVPTYQLEVREGDRITARLMLDGDPLLRNTSPADAFSHMVWHVMNEAVTAAAARFLIVHAGVVLAPDGSAVVLPAASGGGKTTLVAGLVRAGFAFLSDEMAAVDPEDRVVIPVPRSLFVKSGTFEALGMSPPEISPDARLFLDGTWPVTPDDLRAGSLGGPATVRTVVAPAYRPGSDTSIEPISRAAGLTELARNAFNLDAFGGARGVRLLGEIVGPAACYRLAVGPLSDAVAAVAAAAASAA
ncbi:MAG: hypothetical protein ACRDKS_16385, partial [Actinomycetota bacterium]